MADTVQDITTRLIFTMDGDALDFAKTGRGVMVVEDKYANLPLPKGDPGEKGAPGEPGNLRVSLVLDETTDSSALEVLKRRSAAWAGTEVDNVGYFALNEPTRTGFFYTRGGWVAVRDIFGNASEVTPGTFGLPVTYENVAAEPTPAVDGVVVYAFGGSLIAMKQDGTKVTLV